MKHLIILGDGMADHAIDRLNGLTPLQAAHKPNIDLLAREGRTGRLITIPDGFSPGSEVANTAILGYDLNEVYEGRGPLEAASIGYEMRPDDMAVRCNIITLADGRIQNHHGGHLTTEEGTRLILALNEALGDERVQLIPGIQYRHLLVIRGGNKHVVCAPPHDHPNEAWEPLLVKADPAWKGPDEEGQLSAQETADLINRLILRSQQLLSQHPFNLQRKTEGRVPANSIWPWSPGYRPHMEPLSTTYPQLRRGAVISAVDLIKGIGHYAGLRIIEVPGATGLADTNYEGKAAAALEALRINDFVFAFREFFLLVISFFKVCKTAYGLCYTRYRGKPRSYQPEDATGVSEQLCCTAETRAEHSDASAYHSDKLLGRFFRTQFVKLRCLCHSVFLRFSCIAALSCEL